MVATANMDMNQNTSFGDHVLTTACELRSGAAFVGGAVDRRFLPEEMEVANRLPLRCL